MKIELNTTEQFIKETEYCYNLYMNKRLQNQSVHSYHFLKILSRKQRSVFMGAKVNKKRKGSPGVLTM